jgi:hypothetical protein
MALTQEEIDFISSVTEYDENLGYFIYHVTDGSRNDKHNYMAENPITDHVGIVNLETTVGDRGQQYYLIVITPSPDESPTVPADATRIIAGLGD